jgi:hypothetical protein
VVGVFAAEVARGMMSLATFENPLGLGDIEK